MRYFWYRKIKNFWRKSEKQADVLAKKEEQKVETLTEKERCLLSEAQALDEDIVRIQKSTRTLFKSFSTPHVLLRQKYRWYYNWHLKPYATPVHAAVVILALATAAFASTSIILQRPAPAAAAAVTCYWVGDTNPAVWNDATHWSNAAGGGGSTCDSGVVPGSDDTVRFTLNNTNNVTIDTAVNVAGFIIEAGYTGTISQGANTVTVGSSNFSQAGGVFAGSGSSITFNGTWTLTGGTFTATTGTTTFTSNFTHNVATGTFAHNNGTVNFNATAVGRTLDVNTTELFNIVEFNASADSNYYTIASGDSLEIDGALTLTNGEIRTGTLNADSTVSVANTFDGCSNIFACSTLLLNNSAVDQSFTIPNGAKMMGITLNNTNAAPTTINFAPAANATIHCSFTLINGVFNASTGSTTFGSEFIHNVATGTFNHNNGTVIFASQAASSTIDVNSSETFNNVEFNGVYNAIGNADTLIVNGTLTLTDGEISAATSCGNSFIDANSTVSVASTFGGGCATLLLDNNAIDQSFTIPNGTDMMGITLNNPLATIDFASSATARMLGELTLIEGTFTCSNNIVDFLFDFTHNVATGTFNHNNGTVRFRTTDPTYVIDVNTSEIFNNVEFYGTSNSYAYTILEGDSLEVNGTLTLTNGRVHTGTLDAKNHVTIANTFDGGTGILKFSGGNAQTFTDNGGVMMTGGPVVVDKTVGTAVNLATNMTFASAGQDLTITSGTLRLAGRNLVLTAGGDVLTVGTNGTLSLQGWETITASTVTLNAGSTVYYDGNPTITLKPYSYSNLIVNGDPTTVYSASANITGAATITITSGILATAGFDLTATTLVNNDTLRLQGNEVNVTFTTMDTDTGTVEYTGRNVAETLTIKNLGGVGADYYHLSINDTNGTKATFTLGAALDVNGNLSIASGDTFTSGTNFNINIAGSWSNAGTYTSGTNTTTFDTGSAATITTGGTGTTQDFNNFIINKTGGSLQVNTNGLDVDATLTLTNGTLNMNTQPLTANGAYNQANGTFTGSTNSLTFVGDWTLTNGIFTASSGATTFQASFIHTAATGTFNHNNGTVKFKLPFGGEVIDVNSSEIFNNVEFGDIDGFYDNIIGGSDTLIVNGDLSLMRGFIGSMGNSVIDANGQISVSTTFGGTADWGPATLLIDNNAIDQSFTIPNGADMMGFTLNNPLATIDFETGANVRVFGDFTLINGTFNSTNATLTFHFNFIHNVATGTFNHNNGTVKFWSDDPTQVIDVNTSEIFNNVEFYGSINSYAYTILEGDEIVVNGTLTLTNGKVYTGTIDAKGHVTIANTFDGGTGILKFSGGNAQTFTDNGGVMMTGGPVVVDKTVGSAVNLATNMTFASAGQDLTITSGTLDLSSKNLVLTAAGDILTVATNGTLRLEGGETITASTKTFNAGSTVYYDGAGVSYTLKPYSYSNLTINGGAATIFQLGADLNIDGDLTVSSGTFSPGNFTTYAPKNINLTGGNLTPGTSTVILDGTGAQSITSDSETFNILNIDNASSQGVTFADNLNTVTLNATAPSSLLKFTAGTTTTVTSALNFNGQDSSTRVKLRSTADGTRWKLNLSGSQIVLNTDIQDSDASGGAEIDVTDPSNYDSGNNVNWLFVAPTPTPTPSPSPSPSPSLSSSPSLSPENDTVPPIAKISAPRRAVANSDINFNASDSSDDREIASYLWDFGDDTSSDSQKVSKRYYETGSYLVSLRVLDAANNEGAASHKIDIVPPKPEVSRVHQDRNTLSISGKATLVSQVDLYIQSEPIHIVKDVDELGAWTIAVVIDPSTFVEGNHVMWATTTDHNNMTSDSSDYFVFGVSYNQDNKPVDIPISNEAPESKSIIDKTVELVKEAAKLAGEAAQDIGESAVAEAAAGAVALALPLAQAAQAGAAAATTQPFNLYIYLKERLYAWFGFRKKRKPLGVIFNNLTKKPLAFAKVFVYSWPDKRLKETTVSNNLGEFGFLLPAGEYYIKVQDIVGLKQISLEEKQFGKRFNPGETDSYYSDLYYGGEIIKIQTEEEQRGLLSISVPLDPIRNKPFSVKFYNFIHTVAKTIDRMRIYLLSIGTLLAVLALVFRHTRIDQLILGLYILLWILEAYLRFSKTKPYGMVTERTTGKPADFVLLRLISSKTGRIINTCVTGVDGRFIFAAPSGVYTISAVKAGYEPFFTRSFYMKSLSKLDKIEIKLNPWKT